MRRTATHLLSAANPAQLEMRILANHGADERFSFLRDEGRWHQSWLEIKAEIKASKEEEAAAKTKPTVGLGGIAEYGSDSDSEEDGDAAPPPEAAAPAEPPAPPPPLPDPKAPTDMDMELEAAKAQKRARAREWMLSRRK